MVSYPPLNLESTFLPHLRKALLDEGPISVAATALYYSLRETKQTGNI